MSQPQSTQAEAIINFAKDHVTPQLVELDVNGRKAKVLVVPKGLEAKSIKGYLDEYLPAPERRKGTAALGDLKSFIAHVNRFKDVDSVIFADPSKTAPKFTAVIDYHRTGADGTPRFGQHRGVYAFPLSDEWKAWTARNAQKMSQADFAEFIENRVADLVKGPNPDELAEEDPLRFIGSFATPSQLVGLSRNLAVHANETVREAVNLASGEGSIQYVNEHRDASGQPLKVPGAFAIAIPVFLNGPKYQLIGRLRYRVKDGAISWFYELYRSEKVFDHAFEEACVVAQSETGIPLFVGSPEA